MVCFGIVNFNQFNVSNDCSILLIVNQEFLELYFRYQDRNSGDLLDKQHVTDILCWAMVIFFFNYISDVFLILEHWYTCTQ